MTDILKKIKNKLFRWGIYRRKSVTPADADLLRQLLNTNQRLHVGCGDVKLPGFINMDYRQTLATDIVADCTDIGFFPESSLDLVYSHAFFEHLYRLDRVKNLSSVFRSLKPGGLVAYIGFPDFRVVARAYLDGEKGVLGGQFNLFNVYRYTHGDPEHVKGWWLEQLHKSLFDADTVDELLFEAGFRYYIIFNYRFKQEHIPLNMGFVAFKQRPEFEVSGEWLSGYLGEITDVMNMDSLIILLNKTS